MPQSIDFKNKFKHLRDTLVVIAMLFAGFCVSYLLNIYISQWIGVEKYGDFSIVRSIVNILTPIILMGGIESVFKFIPYYRVHHPELLKGYLYFFLLIGTLFLVLFGILSLFFLVFSSMNDTLLNMILVFLWLIPASAILVLLGRTLQSYDKPIFTSFMYSICLPGLTLFFGFWIYSIQNQINLWEILTIYGLAMLAISIVFAWLIYKYLLHDFNRVTPNYRKKAWIQTSLQLASYVIPLEILNQTNLILLGIFDPNKRTVGIFAAILVISTLQWKIYQAVKIVFSPIINPAVHSNDHSLLRTLFRRSTLNLISIVIPTTVLLVLFSRPLLQLFGEAYTEATLPFTILIISKGISICFGMSSVFLQYSHYHRSTILPSTTLLLVNIVLCLFLIPPYGILGATIALAVTRLALEIWYTILMVHKKMLKVKSC